MHDSLLIINAGSSSIKFAVYAVADATSDPRPLLRGQIAGIGGDATFCVNDAAGTAHSIDGQSAIANHVDAINRILTWLPSRLSDTRLVGAGHRVVHGGPHHSAPCLITKQTLAELEALTTLAPHHQPHNLAAIAALGKLDPTLPQVACFDTAFHTTQSATAKRLPLPREYADTHGLQRYGFHGLSYAFIRDALARRDDVPDTARILIAHLGHGASLCATRAGRSVATTMGFSTLDGLMMGTRCGGLDPGVLLHLMRAGMDETMLTDLLYNHSGLKGVSGFSADMRELLNSHAPEADDAIDLYIETLVRAIGSMIAAMEGLDGIVFTGGVGENAATVRARIADRLTWLGMTVSASANAAHADLISTPDSSVKAWVIPTNEELAIARLTRAALARSTTGDRLHDATAC